jgi:S-adenosylmethionine decarboxylase
LRTCSGRRTRPDAVPRPAQDTFDTYLISESSLFVYDDRVIILTCGTTLLLKTLPVILKAGADIGLEVCWFQYSRKNFLFPEQQHFPHTSFDTEVSFLNNVFPSGRPFVMGPMNSDHWYLFVADFVRRERDIVRAGVERPERCKIQDKDQMLNVYMYDIDPDVAQLFMKADPLIVPSIFGGDENNSESAGSSSGSDEDSHKDERKDDKGGKGKADCKKDTAVYAADSFPSTAEEATERSGIGRLMKGDGYVTHAHLFEPCGYSMNGTAGKKGEAYWTIHITPEAHCSYASFETNFACPSYKALINRVVAVFRPQRLTTVEHVDQDSCIGLASPVVPAEIGGYSMDGRSFNEFGCKDYCIQMCNYSQQA